MHFFPLIPYFNGLQLNNGSYVKMNTGYIKFFLKSRPHWILNINLDMNNQMSATGSDEPLVHCMIDWLLLSIQQAVFQLYENTFCNKNYIEMREGMDEPDQWSFTATEKVWRVG